MFKISKEYKEGIIAAFDGKQYDDSPYNVIRQKFVERNIRNRRVDLMHPGPAALPNEFIALDDPGIVKIDGYTETEIYEKYEEWNLGYSDAKEFIKHEFLRVALELKPYRDRLNTALMEFIKP